VYLGRDRERLEALAGCMPPVFRAGSLVDKAPPEIGPGTLLRNYMDGLLDEALRPDTGATKPPSAKANQHRHWIAGLSTPKDATAIPTVDYTPMLPPLRNWKRPLAAQLEASHRLCFQLVEPSDDDGPWLLSPLLQDMRDLSHYIDLGTAWKRKELRSGLLVELAHAAGVYPDLSKALKGEVPDVLELDGEQALAFLSDWAATLEQAGFRVLLPSWWTRTGTKQRMVARGKAKASSAASRGIINMDTLVDFSWEIAIGDHTLTLKELRDLARAKSPLMRIRGQWVHVSVDQIQQALKYWEQNSKGTQLTLGEIMRLSIGLSESPLGADVPITEIKGSGKLGSLLRNFSDASKLKDIPPPSRFTATLRPYQQRGYTWLRFLQNLGLGACLADDMGLGKTVQALAMIQKDREEGASGPVLLVCPTSVMGNWQRETERFAPGLKLAIHHGPTRAKSAITLKKLIRDNDILITTYPLLQRDQQLLTEVDWRGVVLDEAQYIKNHNTRQAKSARSLTANWRIALSGTPVENNVGELWSIMEFLNPGMLGTQAAFDRNFIKPIQRESNDYTVEKLRRATGPFVLRRLKTDKSIISDLPDKVDNVVYCQLTREQGSLYAAAIAEAEENLESDEDGIKRKGVILGLLSRLKQICNHPAQFLGDASTVEGRSGKLTRFGEMLEEVIHGGEHALVFTQFTEMGDILKPYIEERFGREVFFLKGAVSRKQRDEMVRRFQEDADAPPVFLLSLRAGGTGLNLTRASHVFHFDRWWNPAVENQATDRAFRIGQTRNVQVHKFVCMGTLEERIDEMITAKAELADKIVGSGEGWITEMSNTEIRKLVALGKDAVLDNGGA
ncbi:MAG: DEAD/DEAH box helicase, partial [Candidatus Sumerlaeia bacterium]|nr:DEAD/DEAH box helicase [Candidatus Sumerlaeia bacterium]